MIRQAKSPDSTGHSRSAAPFFSALKWVVLFLAAVAAVSCAGIGDACEFDSDCSGGNLCIENTCYAACSDEQDCEPPYEVCKAHTRQNADVEETVKACVDEDFGDPDDPNHDCADSGDCCTDDAECVTHFEDEAAICGIDNRCIIPVAPPLNAVLIRDRSEVDLSEDPADGGLGADIGAVYVRAKGSQEPLGHAVTLDYAPVNEARGSAEIFDGSAADLDESGQCVAGNFEEATASLGGEGGSLLVAFEDAQGNRLRLNTAWEVVVIEWGANCSEAASADAFDVYFCSRERTAASNASGGIDSDAHCERKLNIDPVTGYQVLTLGTGG